MSLPKGRSPPASQVRAGISQAQIQRGPSPQTRDDRIHASAVSTVVPVYSTVPRQPGPPSAPYGTAHEMNKSAQPLAPSQPPHAHSPGLPQHAYVSNQPGPPSLVYPTVPPPQQSPMNAQAQQSRQFPTGARPTHHQVLTAACLGGFRPIQFMQPRTLPQNSGARVPGTQQQLRGIQTAPNPAMYPTGSQPHTTLNLAMPFVPTFSTTGTGPQFFFTPQNQAYRQPYVSPSPQYQVPPAGTPPIYSGPGPGQEYSYGEARPVHRPVSGAPQYYPSPSQTTLQTYSFQPNSPFMTVQANQQPSMPKRERKQIRIRDPTQGGKDITEEIMSGGSTRNPTPPSRASTTPTPPQPQSLPVPPGQSNGESSHVVPTHLRQGEEKLRMPVSVRPANTPTPPAQAASPALSDTAEGERPDDHDQAEFQTAQTQVEPCSNGTVLEPTIESPIAEPEPKADLEDEHEHEQEFEPTELELLPPTQNVVVAPPQLVLSVALDNDKPMDGPRLESPTRSPEPHIPEQLEKKVESQTFMVDVGHVQGPPSKTFDGALMDSSVLLSSLSPDDGTQPENIGTEMEEALEIEEEMEDENEMTVEEVVVVEEDVKVVVDDKDVVVEEQDLEGVQEQNEEMVKEDEVVELKGESRVKAKEEENILLLPPSHELEVKPESTQAKDCLRASQEDEETKMDAPADEEGNEIVKTLPPSAVAASTFPQIANPSLPLTASLTLPSAMPKTTSSTSQPPAVLPSEPLTVPPTVSPLVSEVVRPASPSTSIESKQDKPANYLVAANAVPKKPRKDLNKKELDGDLMSAFKEGQQATSPKEEEDEREKVAEEKVAATLPIETPVVPPKKIPADEASKVPNEAEAGEEKNVENASTPDEAAQSKYQYKEGFALSCGLVGNNASRSVEGDSDLQGSESSSALCSNLTVEWKPLNPEAKKRYDREFLLQFQYSQASTRKPEGLPPISDVVLETMNKATRMEHHVPRIMKGPDFTPHFANLGRPQPLLRSTGSVNAPRRLQTPAGKTPRKILPNVSLSDDVKLNKSDHAWKPTLKREVVSDDPEIAKTQELFRRVRSILNKLTPQMFQQLMKQVSELKIDTEERLKGVIDLVFEKAIDEPSFSVAYANMCRCLAMLKVQVADKPGTFVNFRKLLLNRCQKEFEKDKDDDDIFEKKQKELEAYTSETEKTRLQEELVDSRDAARRRSLGNIRFIGELFKLKMLTEPIMHDCLIKLLKTHEEESLECLCRLLTTIGKDLDFEKAKPRMDQYFQQMGKIVKERKTSSRIRFMVQDVVELRMTGWVPRRGDQGPKTIEQIHREAQIEEHQQHIRVQQQLSGVKDKDKRGRVPSGPHSHMRPSQQADDGWNVVPISKGSRPIDPSKLPKLKPTVDDSIQLGPGGRIGNWGRGSSGGSGTKPESESTRNPALGVVNRYSALQNQTSPVSVETNERRPISRGSTGRDRTDRNVRQLPTTGKGSFGRELMEERSREVDIERESMPRRREERPKEREDERRVRESRAGKVEPPPAAPPIKLTEEEMERKSRSIIEEFLHLNDLKEAMQCVRELEVSQLSVFVRIGIESTLERSTISREHMGNLLCQLVHNDMLPRQQYFHGLSEILEISEDMAIDIPHIWMYLAELMTPMLVDGGIPMAELFTSCKVLLPSKKAGVLLSDILHLLCKRMSHMKVASQWRQAGLNWSDFLPENENISEFLTAMKLEFTVAETPAPGDAAIKPMLSPGEVQKQLERLLQDKVDNERIFDWIEAQLDENQTKSPWFIRALMTAICNSVLSPEWKPLNPEAKKRYDREFLLQFQYSQASTRKPEGLPPISDVVLETMNKATRMEHHVPRIMKGPDFTPHFANLGRPQPLLRSTGSVNAPRRLQTPAAEWKPLNPEAKKRYDREFLLQFQYSQASTRKPEGLPPISDVVLETMNKATRMEHHVPRIMKGPDFTPHFANLGRPQPLLRSTGSVNAPRRLQTPAGKTPQKILPNVSLSDDVKLNKSDHAWKPTLKREVVSDDPEIAKTQELFRRVRSILNKLTPQMFQQLMKQVSELKIDTEERLKGVIDLVFEKAIDEPSFSVAYANMCRCLAMLKVQVADKPGTFVNFRKLLLNRCQKEFEKDKDDDDIFEKKQKELEAYTSETEKTRLQEELVDSRDAARRRSLGNIRFIGELFKLKMLTEPIMHDCLIKLLKTHEEESLECLCCLLTTIGKDLDFEKAKPRMDQYFQQMGKIVKERKTSSPIRLMVQDVVELRMMSWVPLRGDQGPKTIRQIHREAQIEEHQQHIRVQQQLSGVKDKDKRGRVPSGPHSHKSTRNPALGVVNRYSALQNQTSPVSVETNERRPILRGSTGRDRTDRNVRQLPTTGKGSFGRELMEERSREVDIERESMPRRREERPKEREDERRVRESRAGKVEPPPAAPPIKLTEEEMERKSRSIIEEFLHLNDLKEAMQCVRELEVSQLSVFVRIGIESTLERSTISREHMGNLLCQLVHNDMLPRQQYFHGLSEILEISEDMAIDIPHIWMYLAELMTPMLVDGGIPMAELFTSCKVLLPSKKAGVLLSDILHLLCKRMSHMKVASQWRQAGLNWSDFLPENENISEFLTAMKLEFTVAETPAPGDAAIKPMLSPGEVLKQLERLLQDKVDNERIFDWIEAQLDENQTKSPWFIRALMTAICNSVLSQEDKTYRVDSAGIQSRGSVLVKYLNGNEQRQLQALYALQALVFALDQPPLLLKILFDNLYDEDVISEDAFYRWEDSKDPAEQQGKGVALKSVTAFFTWLREADEESEDS
uniref:eukaryotic translation initiation factor 4 gamma 3-like isoform X17 n=1 Tax=Myxine glutinosa TaxID=7769 RepID=UPI00358F0589